ncbi:MAG TPA: hypothetical protein VFN41_09725, partial [Candidatus Limnocylindrales bacterium]|nr:hypothetical protein [Candidatus Limnocylindrales bacterium]
MFRRPFASRSHSRWIALLPALVLAANAAIPVSADEPVRIYSATWLVDSETTASTVDLPGGTTSDTLRITNDSTSTVTLGSARITLPSDYVLTDTEVFGDSIVVPNLGLDAGQSADVPMDIRTPCLPNTTAVAWTTAARSSSDFSESDDFTLTGSTPSTTRNATSCQIRFANQPNTTKTNNVIKNGYNSTAPELKVEIFDPATDGVVETNATVTLSTNTNPSGGTLSGASESASNGTATFSNLKVNKPGPYTLDADSVVVTNTDTSDPFLVGDTVAKCTGP